MHEGIAPTLQERRSGERDGHRLLGWREAVSASDRASGGCDRWPKNLRLASSSGRLVPGRCRSTNLCAYCQRLYTVETVECLSLDAMAGDAPTAWCVLTAREHLTRAEFNEALRIVRKRLRRQGWRWDYFCAVEFQKRGALHANLLVKLRAGPGDELDLIAELARSWCGQVDAEHVAQWGELIVQELGGAASVTAYINKELAHGMKQEQRAPLGWRGHRTSHSRGYFGRPMWQVRAEARASLQYEREVWKAESDGHEAAEAHAIAEVAMLRRESERYELVVLVVEQETGELRRVRPASGGDFAELGRSEAYRERLRRRVEDAGRALRVLDELARERERSRAAVGRNDTPVPAALPLPPSTFARRE